MKLEELTREKAYAVLNRRNHKGRNDWQPSGCDLEVGKDLMAKHLALIYLQEEEIERLRRALNDSLELEKAYKEELEQQRKKAELFDQVQRLLIQISCNAGPSHPYCWCKITDRIVCDQITKALKKAEEL